jgi:hypothetical protein
MALAGTGAELAHLTPRPEKDLWGSNYLNIAGNDFNFAKQFLPEVYEKEVERYGNRTISGFLKMVGAEMPMASDEVVWSEQGRIHVAFDDMSIANSADTTSIVTFTGASAVANCKLVKIGDTVVISKSGKSFKAYITEKPSTSTITCKPYAAANIVNIGAPFVTSGSAITAIKLFVYGSEYGKGSSGVGNSIDASFTSFSNKPIILRDKYSVSGSDTAQIGWVEVTSELGTSGYLWYLKSEHEARLRFEDQLEMAMIEAEKAAQTITPTELYGATGFVPAGSEGLFAAIESRGIVYNDADFGDTETGEGIVEFDNILKELDRQGAIEENMIFANRDIALAIDTMLANQNSYGAGGTSYGVFNNEEDMALNLGFSGFRRGSYDFYKTDWKYLNDSTTRGNAEDVEGVLVPAGTSTVYDQSLGQNVKRPFLHVRYRASEADDRKLKSWITGSVGGNYTSDEDAMNVHFLSERCLCVQAANNFVLLKKTDSVHGD